MDLKVRIEEVWKNRELLKDPKYADAIRAVIEETDKGRLRGAEPAGNEWKVNEWIKQAMIMYFSIKQLNTWTVGPVEFYDKMALKKNYAALGVRAVPHAIARYGAFLGKTV